MLSVKQTINISTVVLKAQEYVFQRGAGLHEMYILT